MIIEQENTTSLSIGKTEYFLYIEQDDEPLEIDKQGAKQLIKVLQEFVGKNKDTESEALRLNNLR